MENQFTVGDWVEVINHIYIGGYVGYVSNKPRFHNFTMVPVVLTKDEEDTPFFDKDEYLIRADQLVKLDVEMNEDDLQTMIEMSLATKDEKWFNDLTTQLQKVSLGGY